MRVVFDTIEAYQNSIGPAAQMTCDLTVSKMGAVGAVNVNVPESATRIEVFDVRALMYFVSPDGSQRFLGEGIPFNWNPVTLPLEGSYARVALLFPLAAEQISLIEDLRKGGKVRLKATVRILGATDTPPAIVPVQEMEVRQGSSQFIDIEKSKWVEDILPRLGWGSWRTIEIPFSGALDGLTKIDEVLSEAQKQYGLGNWADCLTACRKAVEELQPYAKEFVNLVHSDDKGGPAPEKIEELVQEFQNLSKSMMEFQAGVRKMLAAGAHKLPPGMTFDRADAELGLLLTVALRRYVGLRMLKEKA